VSEAGSQALDIPITPTNLNIDNEDSFLLTHQAFGTKAGRVLLFKAEIISQKT
jgi:hypothetical protein